MAPLLVLCLLAAAPQEPPTEQTPAPPSAEVDDALLKAVVGEHVELTLRDGPPARGYILGIDGPTLVFEFDDGDLKLIDKNQVTNVRRLRVKQPTYDEPETHEKEYRPYERERRRGKRVDSADPEARKRKLMRNFGGIMMAVGGIGAMFGGVAIADSGFDGRMRSIFDESLFVGGATLTGLGTAIAITGIVLRIKGRSGRTEDVTVPITVAPAVGEGYRGVALLLTF